jgi:hypothetical protein
MDSENEVESENRVIDLRNGEICYVKYTYKNSIYVIANGHHVVLFEDQYTPYSPLMEALLCQT